MNTREARERIKEVVDLNIYISLTDEECQGPVVAVKDLIDVRGAVTTGGGIILPQEPAAEDAPVIRNIRSHGCCVIGKASTHEWACGVTNENPHYGVVRNPVDPERIPGGSSGGSAAAVAAGTCDWAIGTDTGGSIRIPASLCGVVGLKPTVGTVRNEGVIPLSRTLDTVGPLAPDVRTSARALEMMANLSGLVPDDFPTLSGFKLAVPSEWVQGLDEQTQETWDRVRQGLPEIPFPGREQLTNVFQPIFFAEGASYHREWVESCSDRYGSDVLGMLRRGLAVLAVDYVHSLRQIEPCRREVEQAMSDWDALLLPTSSIVAPPIGTPHVREKLLRFTRPFTLTGHPVITVPAPVSRLPVGIQVVGHFGRDADLLRVARALELAWQG